MIEGQHHTIGTVNGIHIGNLKQDIMLAAIDLIIIQSQWGHMLQYYIDLYSGSMGPHAAILYRLVFRIDGTTCCNII
jgi:hypothetical protein